MVHVKPVSNGKPVPSGALVPTVLAIGVQLCAFAGVKDNLVVDGFDWIRNPAPSRFPPRVVSSLLDAEIEEQTSGIPIRISQQGLDLFFVVRVRLARFLRFDC